MKKPEKIQILQIITNLELGGAQKHALSLIKYLDRSKYKVHFISAPQGLLLKEAQAVSDVQLCLLSTLNRRISPVNDIKSLLFIVKYIKQYNIQIVHTHSSKAGIIGRWAGYIAGGRAIIHTVHGWSFNDYQGMFLKNFYVFLERITAKITTAFIAVARHDIRKGLQHQIGREKQYNLIHYGIEINTDISSAQKTQAKKELGIDSIKVCVGMIACLKPQKNPLDFIRLASQMRVKHPEVMFISAGEGILRDSMRALIKEKKLESRVKLCGWRKDIETILAISDIIVLTSLWEGMPIALLEAMAFSKPIAAYASDGVKEMILDGENGYLIQPRDVSSLSAKVDFLLSNPVQTDLMRAKARAFFETPIFRVQYMLEKTHQLYQACLGK